MSEPILEKLSVFSLVFANTLDSNIYEWLTVLAVLTSLMTVVSMMLSFSLGADFGVSGSFISMMPDCSDMMAASSSLHSSWKVFLPSALRTEKTFVQPKRLGSNRLWLKYSLLLLKGLLSEYFSSWPRQ